MVLRMFEMQAIQAALHVSRQLPEHASLIAFAAGCHGSVSASQVQQASTEVDRLSNASSAQVLTFLVGGFL